MERQSIPVISSEWLAAYWKLHPRIQDEDVIEYNKRLIDQVRELLQSDQLKLSPEY
jgi:hypothetical protein